MLLKLLTLLGVVLALYGLARRASALLGGGGTVRAAPVTDMARCRVCGAWHAAAERCRCAVPPTP